MIIFDSSYLIAFLHPDPPPPTDREGKPVEKFKERIQELVSELNGSDILIGVPAPVVAEILVRYEADRDEYLNTLRQRYRFDIIPFGIKAAIEAADLVSILKREHKKQPGEQWAKIKFDIQITAMARAESNLTMLYADDKDIENFAKRVGIPVTRICDLPVPKVKIVVIPTVDEGGQSHMFAVEEHEPQEQAKSAGEVDPESGTVPLSGYGTEAAIEAPNAESKEPIQAPAAVAAVAVTLETRKPSSDGVLGKGDS